MLEHLYIENIALIDRLEINFKEGLNIISGETGAGKSLVIDSLNFVLGARFGKDFIKRGCDKAIVEAFITIESDEVINELEELGISIDEDRSILINRFINISNKTVSRVNGKAVTIGILKEISSILIDIHGQHEHQSLMNPSRHIVLLDRFCSEKLEEEKHELEKYIFKYRNLMDKIKEIDISSEEIIHEVEMYNYQINEIDDAKLEEDIEEKLAARKKILANSEKLKYFINDTLDKLYRKNDFAAADLISASLKNLNNICILDESKNNLYETLESISLQLDDYIRQLINYNDLIEDNPIELDEIENKLDLIYKLKRKYGATIKDILNYKENVKNKLEIILNSEEKLKKYKDEKQSLEENINLICDKITYERTLSAEKIEKEIEDILKDIGMKNASFKINIETKETFNSNGKDKVEFLISPNLGEHLKPLSQIASGGEISRVMLALKVVLADADNIETFVFDEIDTGVSGRTAQQVANKLSMLAVKRQILCITHLPQIAAMADAHFLVEKVLKDERTITNVKYLSDNESVAEISRLIGGAEITQATETAAKEMKELAVLAKRQNIDSTKIDTF